MLSYRLWLLALFLLTTLMSVAQVGNVEFGKNRVQYNDDQETWYYYETDHFRTFWYGKSKNFGKAAVMLAEMDHNQIQDVLEHHLNQKISIIVFSDISDLQQSNIGTEEIFATREGETKIIGDKIFVHFDGSHASLRRQLREGIASIYLASMITGQNISEVVQNAFFLNWPDWFSSGIVGYLGVPWDVEVDKQLKSLMTAGNYASFDELAQEHPKLTGHAFWYYLGQNYGDATVSNILYMSRVNRSARTGVLYVIGTPMSLLKEEIFNYFKNIYKVENKTIPKTKGEEIELVNRFEAPIPTAVLSPDGRYMLYVTNEIGKVKGQLRDMASKETVRVFKFGERNPFQKTNYKYPIVSWKPNSREFSIMFESRDKLYMRQYLVDDLENPIQTPVAPGIRHIYNAEYVDMEKMVMSVDNKGASDIVLYNTNTRQVEQLTNDLWDDLDVKVVNLRGKKGILFASNRPDPLFESEDIDSFPPIGTFDIFYMGLDTSLTVQITNTRTVNERNPMGIDTFHYSYISDASGTPNREAGYLEDYIHHYDRIILLKDGTKLIKNADSSIAELDTALVDSMFVVPIIKTRGVTYNTSNLNINLQNHSYSDSTKQTILLHEDTEQSRILVQDSILVDRSIGNRKTYYRNFYEKYPDFYDNSTDGKFKGTKLNEAEKLSNQGFYFQTEFESNQPIPVDTATTTIIQSLTHPLSENGLVKVIGSRIVPYQLKFKSHPLSFSVDNQLLFQGLNTFAGNPSDQFEFPPMGILLRNTFEDILEDYQIELGLRIPVTFRGLEYFMQFQDKKKQLDKIYSIYQKIDNLDDDPNFQAPYVRKKKNIITMLVSEFRYPLDVFRSLRGTATFRNDRILQLASDGNQLLNSPNTPLDEPNADTQRFGLKAEYVFDNSYEHYLNIRFGTRYKFFAEVVKGMQIDFNDGAKLNFNEGFMTILGFDARHYVRLDKHSIFAVRAAGATSFGKEKILYALGGVDGWLTPSYDDTAQPQGNFAFRALAAQMRGFKNNVRNGNNYLLSNIELRIPIMRYIFQRNIRSKFIRDMQLVGFFDAGLAWAGTNPFDPDNPVNTEVIAPSNKVIVNVTYFNDPLVYGYGVGFRTSIFGQFIKLDYAWGRETGRLLDPVLYLSLGMDF